MKHSEAKTIRGRILAVDDDLDQLAMLDAVLAEEGFQVETAASGQDALGKVSHYKPDLILVDVAMPEMNGFTLCETLRKNTATAATPIIMLTGLTTQFARFNALAHGANDFLLKPFATDHLMAKVNDLLSTPRANSGH